MLTFVLDVVIPKLNGMPEAVYSHLDYIIRHTSPLGCLFTTLISYCCACIHLDSLISVELTDLFTLLERYAASLPEGLKDKINKQDQKPESKVKVLQTAHP
jgi:hypothetical protein